jgi:hypothetical protein
VDPQRHISCGIEVTDHQPTLAELLRTPRCQHLSKHWQRPLSSCSTRRTYRRTDAAWTARAYRPAAPRGPCGQGRTADRDRRRLQPPGEADRATGWVTVPAADDLRRTIRRAAWRPRAVLRGFWACLVALFVSGCLMTDQSAFVPGPLQPDNCGTPDEFKRCGRPPKPAAAAKGPDWHCCVPPQY